MFVRPKRSVNDVTCSQFKQSYSSPYDYGGHLEFIVYFFFLYLLKFMKVFLGCVILTDSLIGGLFIRPHLVAGEQRDVSIIKQIFHVQLGEVFFFLAQKNQCESL